MLEKVEVIVLAKCDLLDSDMVEDLKSQIEKKTGKKVFPISAPIGEGLEALQDELIKHITKVSSEVKIDEKTIIDLHDRRDDNEYVVTPE